jgi:hypothetical protein
MGQNDEYAEDDDVYYAYEYDEENDEDDDNNNNNNDNRNNVQLPHNYDEIEEHRRLFNEKMETYFNSANIKVTLLSQSSTNRIIGS